MPCPPTQPPWEFLLSASRNSLQSYELSRLSHPANLRKEIGSLLDQWILRIERRHWLKSEVPREVQLIFKLLTEASPPPPSRITLCVIRRGGVPSGQSGNVRPARNQALLPGAPLSLAAVRSSMPPLRISPFRFIRTAPPSSISPRSLTSWLLYRN